MYLALKHPGNLIEIAGTLQQAIELIVTEALNKELPQILEDIAGELIETQNDLGE